MEPNASVVISNLHETTFGLGSKESSHSSMTAGFLVLDIEFWWNQNNRKKKDIEFSFLLPLVDFKADIFKTP